MLERAKMQEMKSVLLNDSMEEKEMSNQLNIFMLIWYKRSTSIFETYFWVISLKFTLLFCKKKKNKSNNNKKTNILAKASKERFQIYTEELS
jgi:hypothetical protein